MANVLFQNAIQGIPQKTPPIWLMRQAGRYHRHYQKLKEKHDFMSLCKVPELAAQVALGPVQDFDFDVAILFSDLLFPLEALGMHLQYAPGPVFDRSLSATDLGRLKPHEEALEGLRFQQHAVRLTRELLPKDKSLIGFVGGPWTLFSYAVGGSHDGNLIEAKKHLSFFSEFCEILVPLLVDNIRLQLEGGAEVVMVFDTAAGELSPDVFRSYVEPQLLRMFGAHVGKLGYYSKGTHSEHLEGLWQQSAICGFGYDHRWDIVKQLQLAKRGFTQGNFDQALLFSDSLTLKNHIQKFLAPLQKLSLEDRKGWVCGLGHGVLPKTPEDHVRMYVDLVRKAFS